MSEIEEKKNDELWALARKYAKEHGYQSPCLPTKGIVKLVLENCPTWQEWCQDYDTRGSGNIIGRRIAKLQIHQVTET